MKPTLNQKLVRYWHKLAGTSIRYVFYLLAATFLVSFAVVVKQQISKPELTTQTWPAGTLISNIDRGGRINTYHRGYMLFGAMGSTSTWDISNPANPEMVHEIQVGDNGHRWWKINDLYYREYNVPELGDTNYRYLDLSNMLNRGPITSSDALLEVTKGNYNLDKLETYPHTIESNRIYDMRSGVQVGNLNIPELEGINNELKVRIGNMVAYTPSNGASGVACFDIGDPTNPKLLDVIDGVALSQYTTTVHVWKHYFIFLNGDNSNEGDHNLVAIDFSNPTDLKYAFGVKLEDSPGRYMFFQDEYGFTGRFKDGVKLNMETLEVETRFYSPTPSITLLDFQWFPIGHILVASGADSDDGVTYFFSHSDKLDTKPPTVSYHLPADGQQNLPVTSTIGFVINEILDDVSLTDETIQVSPVGGEPIEGVVTSTSYQVVNFVPRENLLPNTTYEVKFVQGGVKDAVGNGMDEYTFYFTTTGTNSENLAPEVTTLGTFPASPVVTSSQVTFTTDATDADGDQLLYRWDFGDGSPQTEWSATNRSITHTYSQTGNYTVLVQVSDENGGFISKGTSISVIESLPSDLPTQSGPIMVDEVNRKVWTVNPDNNTVSVIHADNLTKINEINVGEHPTGIALDGEGQVWVSCKKSDELYVLDADLETVIRQVSMHPGSRPSSIVFTPDGTAGYIAEHEAGKVSKINSSGTSIAASIKVGGHPEGLAITGDGSTLLVTQFISPDDAGEVYRINLDDFSLSRTIELPIDTESADNGTTGRGLPNYVASVAIHPNNEQAYTVAKKDNTLRGLARDGQPLVFENTVRTAISPIDLNTNLENTSNRLDIDNHAQPSAITYSTTGNHIFVAMQGNNRIVVIDPRVGKEILRRDVGLAPQGIAIDPVSKQVFVKNFMDRSVTVFDAKELMDRGVGSLTTIATVSTVSSEELEPQILLGKQIFYNAADERMSLEGYISCATCHQDGEQDGRTWDFTDRGEGLRNTIALRGRAGMGHGRLHWTANFDEIHDFENDIRTVFKGTGFLSDGDFNHGTTSLPLGDKKEGLSSDLDALAAYMTSLDDFSPSPYRNDDGSLTSDAIAGKALFSSLNCSSCHSGNAFTDSNTGLLHDIGSISETSGNRIGSELLGLDVPTLKDLWKTAPYLHDGSASTLEDVLTEAHGAVGLINSEKEQLIAYLLQIDESETQENSKPLSLEMTSPAHGSTIASQQEVTLSIQTNFPDVSSVAYYVDSEKVDETTTAPFEGSWNPVKWGAYSVQAKVFYNEGRTASVTAENNVMYKQQLKALYVVGDVNISDDERKIKNRLERQLGLEVTLIDDDDASRPSDADPYDLVVMSTTVEPNIIGGDFQRILTPAIVLSHYIYPNMDLSSGAYGVGYGLTGSGANSISIQDDSHPLAAELTGEVPLYLLDQQIPFGNPENAVVIAQVGDYPVIFGVEQNDDLSSRRTGFPIKRNFLHLFTKEGWQLFDAAVNWTIYGGDSDNPNPSLPDVTITSPINGNLVNSPFFLEFETENWTLPDPYTNLRLKIDGGNRELVTDNTPIEINNLSLGQHTISLQMERGNNTSSGRGASVTVTVTDDPVTTGPNVIITSPTNYAFVKPDFEVSFIVNEWDILPNGDHLKYFVDEVEQGAWYSLDPIPIQGLALGEHDIKLQLAQADNTLTEYARSITVQVDTTSTIEPGTQVYIEYRDGSTGVSTAEIKPFLKLVNNSESNVFYSDLTMRYWFTAEGDEVGFIPNIDYAQPGSSNMTIEVIHISGNDHYIAYGFSSNLGVLSAGGNSGPIESRIPKSNYSTQNQANDYSYQPSMTDFTPHARVTLYQNGNLIWGVEPGDTPPPANRAPNAAATATPLSGTAPLVVAFDAGNSSDPDGDELTYLWNFGDGTISALIATTHTFTEAGSYNVSLTVSDGALSDVTNVVITVSDGSSGNNPPVAQASATPLSGQAPLDVSFSSSGSTDPDGDALTYSWGFGDGDTSTEANPSHAYSSSGSYEVVLVVSDGALTSDPVTLTINVTDPDSGGDCNFNIPQQTPFASINTSFDYIHILGNGGPDLSNLRKFTINWSLPNNGLWQISMETNDGMPSWWNDLLSKTSHTLNASSPTITFSSTGFVGLDGTYDVTMDGENIVMASREGDFILYGSNSSTAPDCDDNARAGNSSSSVPGTVDQTEVLAIRTYPSPAKDVLHVAFSTKLTEPLHLKLFDIMGRPVLSKQIGTFERNDVHLDITSLQPGVYLLKTDHTTQFMKIIKE